MIVKSEKPLWQWIAYATVVITLYALFIIYLMNDVDDLWLKIVEYVLVGICYYIILCMVIVFGRTLILDEKGCTIRFWKYQKTYRWEEFKIKRMEDYRDISRTPTDQIPYSAFVFFSVKNWHKPMKMKPDTYATFLHPFSFSYFFVYFHVDSAWSGRKRCIRYYDVDEKEFLEKMQEWGVELEVHPSPEEQYK